MRQIVITVAALLILAVAPARAAEKDKMLSRVDLTLSRIDRVAALAKSFPDAEKEVERARSAVQRAQETCDKGRGMFGFGALKPGAESEVATLLEMADTSVTVAGQRIETARAMAEREQLDQQLATVRAKVKIFEDRKAAFARAREDAAKYQAAVKELENITAERDQLKTKLATLADELARAEQLKAKFAEQSMALDALKSRLAAETPAPLTTAASQTEPPR